MAKKVYKKHPGRLKPSSPLKDCQSSANAHYPSGKELSLYDIAAVMHVCITALKKHHISWCRFEKLLIANHALYLQIGYFRALDKLPAESVQRGMTVKGRSYTIFNFLVTPSFFISWEKGDR